MNKTNLVADVDVGDLDGDVLERHVLPRRRRVLHHHGRRVVVLVVLAVQVGELAPVRLLLARADQARDVQALGKELEVLHELVGLVARVQDAQLGEDAHVRALEADAALEQRLQRVDVAAAAVELDDLVELVGVDDDVEPAQLCFCFVLCFCVGCFCFWWLGRRVFFGFFGGGGGGKQHKYRPPPPKKTPYPTCASLSSPSSTHANATSFHVRLLLALRAASTASW